MQNLREVVTRSGIHRLSEADIGADGRAEEIQNPKSWNNTKIDLPNESHQSGFNLRAESKG